MTNTGSAKVLVVDDEADVADAYAAQLELDFDVSTAYSGREALDTIDESVDVVLLDRRMPGISGDEVLESIRERGLDCRVAMVTAVDPDFDIIEMPFDDYVQKPVTEGALLGTVAHLVRCLTYDEQLREYYSLTAKRAALIQSKTLEELADSERFSELEAEIQRAEAALSDLVADFDPTDFDRAFRDIDRPEPPRAD